MLYRKIQPYIESYLKSDSNKVLIIEQKSAESEALIKLLNDNE